VEPIRSETIITGFRECRETLYQKCCETIGMEYSSKKMLTLKKANELV
jgi:hypothetical protein